jgi:hypothetical protein
VKVFVSYCHRQGQWVHSALVPCLKAGGATVLVDAERFQAGGAVLGQMDAVQDEADQSLLVLSPDYLASDYCRHELERAVARDPVFRHGRTVPVLVQNCPLPKELKEAEPVWVDLRDPSSVPGWKLLLEAAGAELGCAAARWLESRDELVMLLERNRSVNFVVPHRGATGSRPRWKELVEHLKERHFPGLGCVDLERGAAASRPGLVGLMLEALGHGQPVPEKPHDLEALDRALELGGDPPRLALLHFDLAGPRLGEYGVDLFASIRSLVEDRRIVLLIQSRRAFMQLVPREHPLSQVQLNTVELDCS